MMRPTGGVSSLFHLISYFSDSSDPKSRDFFVSATFVMVAGFIVSLGTATTGFWDWWKGIDREPTGLLGRAQHTQVWRTINTHMAIMLSVTAIAIVDIVARLAQSEARYSPGVVVILSVVTGALVTIGAAYGGSLVYDYQFNVEGLKGSTAWDETEVDQLPGGKVAPSTAQES